ncbi:hypothetical protein GF351_00575 [Candidatus Woesearchaeota archaeon]|nr:hypothetical protein [Candidatus Woesearchaeota archaeon]
MLRRKKARQRQAATDKVHEEQMLRNRFRSLKELGSRLISDTDSYRQIISSFQVNQGYTGSDIGDEQGLWAAITELKQRITVWKNQYEAVQDDGLEKIADSMGPSFEFEAKELFRQQETIDQLEDHLENKADQWACEAERIFCNAAARVENAYAALSEAEEAGGLYEQMLEQRPALLHAADVFYRLASMFESIGAEDSRIKVYPNLSEPMHQLLLQIDEVGSGFERYQEAEDLKQSLERLHEIEDDYNLDLQERVPAKAREDALFLFPEVRYHLDTQITRFERELSHFDEDMLAQWKDYADELEKRASAAAGLQYPGAAGKSRLKFLGTLAGITSMDRPEADNDFQLVQGYIKQAEQAENCLLQRCKQKTGRIIDDSYGQLQQCNRLYRAKKDESNAKELMDRCEEFMTLTDYAVTEGLYDRSPEMDYAGRCLQRTKQYLQEVRDEKTRDRKADQRARRASQRLDAVQKRLDKALGRCRAQEQEKERLRQRLKKQGRDYQKDVAELSSSLNHAACALKQAQERIPSVIRYENERQSAKMIEQASRDAEGIKADIGSRIEGSYHALSSGIQGISEKIDAMGEERSARRPGLSAYDEDDHRGAAGDLHDPYLMKQAEERASRFERIYEYGYDHLHREVGDPPERLRCMHNALFIDRLSDTDKVEKLETAMERVGICFTCQEVKYMEKVLAGFQKLCTKGPLMPLFVSYKGAEVEGFIQRLEQCISKSRKSLHDHQDPYVQHPGYVEQQPVLA